ncbi:MAG: aminotransferase class V-fold PLP-dependent enzyme [Frankia sp.]
MDRSTLSPHPAAVATPAATVDSVRTVRRADPAHPSRAPRAVDLRPVDLPAVPLTGEDFPGRRGFLNTATLGLPCTATLAALDVALAQWSAGSGGPGPWDEPVGRARTLFAGLVGVPASWVSVASHVSAVIGTLAASLPSGATVLTADGDFTSVLFPFLAQRERGVRVRSVPLDRLLDALDSRVDWVAVSAVQSATGAVLDLDGLAERADAVGARVCLDATQAAGWLPVDAGRFAMVTCAGYKWLSNPRGTCFTSMRPEATADVVPHLAGWYAGPDALGTFYGAPLRLAPDARRFDLSPAWFSWIGAVAPLEILTRIGVAAVHRHDVGLADGFRARLGLAPAGSAIVSVEASDSVRARLAAAGVVTAGREGRVRLAFHHYNDATDVDRAASCW